MSLEKESVPRYLVFCDVRDCTVSDDAQEDTKRLADKTLRGAGWLVLRYSLADGGDKWMCPECNPKKNGGQL